MPPFAATASYPRAVLKDFSIEVQPQQAAAGELKFRVENHGTVTHELNIYKSSLPLDQLPIDNPTNKVDENSPQIQQNELSIPIPAGTSTDVAATLPAGTYYFVCNQPGHYKLGMRLSYTVR